LELKGEQWFSFLFPSFLRWAFPVLPKLTLNSEAPAILSPQPPKVLGLQVHPTMHKQGFSSYFSPKLKFYVDETD
jgi:hypothetical protein